MDRPAAVKLILDTFENSFDKARFVGFAKNLLNRIDETKAFYIQGHYVPEIFRDHVTDLPAGITFKQPQVISRKCTLIIMGNNP
ncbi:MAG: hypothetical protein R6V59_05665 [Dehalococcoidia bacterium]